jgi:hypothetical protein
VPGLNAVLAAHELAPVRNTFELFDRCPRWMRSRA